jgi:hypothetical protein
MGRLEAAVKWTEKAGAIDPTMPYLCRLPSGRSLAIFFYDGPISRAVAFEQLRIHAQRQREPFLQFGVLLGQAQALPESSTDGSPAWLRALPRLYAECP